MDYEVQNWDKEDKDDSIKNLIDEENEKQTEKEPYEYLNIPHQYQNETTTKMKITQITTIHLQNQKSLIYSKELIKY